MLNLKYDTSLMPKIRQRGYKTNNYHKSYSKGIKLRKKRGHQHQMILTKNTKNQDVQRCTICKHHFFIYYNEQTTQTTLLDRTQGWISFLWNMQREKIKSICFNSIILNISSIKYVWQVWKEK